MATSTPVAARNQKVVRKTITFAAGAGTGDVGTVAALTCTGTVWIKALNLHCTTNLAGASATISLGISGDPEALIPYTTATTIDAGMQWVDAVPSKVDQPIRDITVSDNLIFTIATAGITAGVIEIEVVFESLSANGYLS